ncbi:hypothetical protein I350_06341 [Cryptococcus amylolentus CBS 6273]|uniref:Myb-like DNA-binding domain-containing protein n=1 Tax=Cryptococcus amylolentus CBS 6273 TaxID=1296118 RepID=A0A1E3JKX4_9TREE|nr:hypothetical protein I350_06341 [Cryptococcus amylolentus CBS 6273]
MSVTSSSSDHLSPQQPTQPHAKRRPWTLEEDALLIDAVNRLGSARGPGSAWSEISSIVGGTRTNKDCRKRWFHSLDPSLRKGRWSREEDEALKRLHKEMGPQWKEIALLIPGRKDDQCSKRWRDVLDPCLTSKKAWTPLEDALLLQLFEAHGAKWSVISDSLPGRSPLACRNRSRKYFDLTRGNNKVSASAARHTSPHHHTVEPKGDYTTALRSADTPPLDGTLGLFPWGLPGELPPDGTPGLFPWEAPDAPLLGSFPEDNSPQLEMARAKSAPEIWKDLMKNNDQMNMSNAQNIIPTPALDQGYMDQWLSLFQQSNSAAASSSQSQTQTVFAPPIKSPSGLSSATSSALSLPSIPAAPVSDPWALFAALENGQASVNVDAQLLRKLMADAAKGTSAVDSRV